MSFYPPNIAARFRSPLYAGIAAAATAAGASASFECGSFVRFSLAIEYDSQLIREARYQSNGCGFMIAAADAAAEFLTGTKLIDLHGLGDDRDERLFADRLEEFPTGRKQCGEIVLSAVKTALAHHREHLLEEFRGEKALICTCFGVTEETIQDHIDANPGVSVAGIAKACRAGGGCGSCRMLIQEMIDSRESRDETV